MIGAETLQQSALRAIDRLGLPPPDWKPRLRDGVADALAAAGVTAPKRSGRGGLTVLTLHRVLPAKKLLDYPMSGLAMTPEQLQAVCEHLAEHYCCLPLSSAYRLWVGGTAVARPLLSLTFDDGAADNFEHAKPVLDACGVKASFYVPVACVQDRQAPWPDRLGFALLKALATRRSRPTAELDAWLAPFGVSSADFAAVLPEEARVVCQRAIDHAKSMPPAALREGLLGLEKGLGPCVPDWAAPMSWEQLRTLHAEGHEIGSHSLSHPLLTQCPPAQLQSEIRDSKAQLEEGLGAAVTSFCYPDGDYDDRCLSAVTRAGYLCAATTRWGINRSGASAVELKRCDVDYARLLRSSGDFSPQRLWLRLSGLQPNLV